MKITLDTDDIIPVALIILGVQMCRPSVRKVVMSSLGTILKDPAVTGAITNAVGGKNQHEKH